MDIKNMTLREKIGQTVMIQKPEKYIEQFGSAEKFLEKYPIGSIYYGGDTVGGPMDGIDANDNVLKELKMHSRIPLAIAGDFNMRDGGKNAIRLPDAMTLGATHSAELARKWGQCWGCAAKKKGLDWIFMPVADLNLIPNNPIVSVRSLGDDPELVGNMIENLVLGIQDCGVAATLKHFPGHGTEEIDPHVAPTFNNLSSEDWDKTFGKVFSQGIKAGAMSVMTAHNALPSKQSENELSEDGFYAIATLSKELTTDLLKKELCFNGVVVTDGLLMGGFSGSNCDMEIKTFECGSDVLLWPSLEYMDVLEQKILSGEISEERLDDAVNRVLELKKRTIGIENHIEIDSDEIVNQVAEESITLLNNKANILPLDKSKVKKVLLVTVSSSKAARDEMSCLKDIMEADGIEVIVKEDIWIPEMEKYEPECDLIIFAISRKPGGIGTIDIYGDNAVSVWASQASKPEKTVIASFGSPYLYSKYYKHIDTYINAYSSSKEVLNAFYKAIFGEILFVGKTPVKL